MQEILDVILVLYFERIAAIVSGEQLKGALVEPAANLFDECGRIFRSGTYPAGAGFSSTSHSEVFYSYQVL